VIVGVRKVTFVFVIAMLLGLAVSPVHAQPQLPQAFYGSLEINDEPAPVGTEVEARGDGVTLGGGNPIMTTEAGQYGSANPLGAKLIVQGDIAPDTIITFYVNGVSTEQTVAWEGGAAVPVTELDLTVTIGGGGSQGGGGASGGGGGGGAAAADTTPPRISNVASCPEGVTETTADICWTTHEKSTSQVEYWTSPSMLSPLDETLVTQHHVQLTGLTPGTTYHYRTMSMDRAGNAAVSDEYTLTTLGEAPAAAFTTSNLSVSPSEVNIGESVTISVLVTNTGDVAGSYEVPLKIDDLVVASEEVSLAAGDSQTVTFTAAKDVTGSHSVNVNGLSGSFTVKEEAPAPPAPAAAAPAAPAPPSPAPTPPSAINWAVLGPIVGVALFLAIFLPIRLRRRRV